MKGSSPEMGLAALVVCCVVTIVSSYCDPGWEHFPGTESCYFFSTAAHNSNDARQDCMAKRSRLVDIRSHTENNFITARVGSSPRWIGMRRTPSMFFWNTDANPVNQDSYTNWEPSEPNNAGAGPEDCAEMVGSGKWNDVPCSRKYAHVCKKRKVSGSCQSGWQAFQAYCYYFGSGITTWDAAKTDCAARSSYIVDIHSSDENTFIKGKLGSSYAFWMGMRRQKAEWYWNGNGIEIASYDYKNWDSNEPSANSDNSCAEIGTSGKWKSNTCRDVTQRYICEAPDCALKSYGSFGPCTVTCGEGVMARTVWCFNKWFFIANIEQLPCKNTVAC